MLSGKIRPATEIVSSYMNGAFSFDISNYLRNRMLRRNRDQHMDMIRLQMTLLDSALPLLGQVPKHLSQILSKLSKEHFPPILWNPDNVILAFPHRVT